MKKNIYLILADEQLFHPHYVRDLLKNLDSKTYAIVGITIAKAHNKKGLSFFLKQQLILWGPLGFLFFIKATILTKVLTHVVPNKQLDVYVIAKKNGIKVIEAFNVNSEDHLTYLKKLKIDIIISSNGHIFKEELLTLPRIACINRHTALLPQYGGVLPVFWAMKNNEKYFGVSLHFMTKKIDEGDIIYQEKIAFKHDASLLKNYLIGFEKSGNATIEALNCLRNNKVMEKYDKKRASYNTFPTFEQMQELRKRKKAFSIKDIKPFFVYYLH